MKSEVLARVDTYRKRIGLRGAFLGHVQFRLEVLVVGINAEAAVTAVGGLEP